MNTFTTEELINTDEITFNQWRDFLIDDLMVNEDVIDCMCSIHGYTVETLDDVCYWKFGMTCMQMLIDIIEEGC